LRIAICAGGTAGHVYPAIALADEITLEEPESEVIFVGTKRGLESRLVPEAGFEFKTIDAKGFKRKITLENISALISLEKGFFESRSFFQEFKPNVVVGLGGYASAPPLVAARLLKIPCVIHEQNSYPGLVNRLMSRFVDVVATSFPGGEKAFPSAKRVIYTGNPIRRRMIGSLKDSGLEALTLEKDKKTVLIFGGSQGAQKINESVIEAYQNFKDIELQIIHITGKDHFNEVCDRMKRQVKTTDKVRYQAHPYLNNISDAYAAADLVVSRAGATTLAELTALGVPSILVPYPYATGDHQLKNAQSLENHGAAKIILNSDIDGNKLFEAVNSIIFDRAVLAQMKERASSLGKPYAANDLAKVVLDESNKIQILKA
jgi:UDP-N-acetylglucosamine--N-acetylmuramyl-(pentapeptide) pyrophosphoryl-undecaprenol N-acetylglucosamine transferase